jgi:hypothetical protein
MVSKSWSIYAFSQPFESWNMSSARIVGIGTAFIGEKDDAILEMRKLASENNNPKVLEFCLFGSNTHERQGMLLVSRCIPPSIERQRD